MSELDNSLPPPGSTLQKALEALVTTLNEGGIQYAIIGGLAVIQHTRVRTTDDIDALLTVPQVALPRFFEALRQRGFAANVATNVPEFRDEGITAITYDDVIVDLMRPVIPAYSHVLERAIWKEIAGQRVRLCTAEGLVITKLISFRPQDEADVKEVVMAYREKLDVDFIRTEMDSFMEPTDPRRAKFEAWVKETGFEGEAIAKQGE